MLTGIKPLRTRPIPVGGTWTLPPTWATTQATTQTMFIPLYKIRNCPDRVFNRYANALIGGATSTMRQRLATNGYEVEVCPTAVSDGIFYNTSRNTISIWTGYAGATVVGGSQSALVRGGIGVTPYDDKTYTNALANMWHEMVWAELGIYFPAGQRPAGHTNDVLISDWTEIRNLITDCVNNGANAAWSTDPAAFCNTMRCGQRSEDYPTITTPIPFNATNTQVKTAIENLPFIRTVTQWPAADITVTGGALPTAVTISFGTTAGGFQGQYYQKNVVPLTVASNNLNTGSPSLSVTTPGTGWGTPTSLTMSLTTTGSPTSGTFTLTFKGGVDRMLETVGPGTTGTTPQQRVNTWLSICSTNSWTT